MRNVNAEIRSKEVKRDTTDNRIFPLYRGVDAPPIHVGALTKSITPP
jgi:hypothetical protein